MPSLESGVSLVTDLAKQIELDHQLGTINPWPLPLKFRLAYDSSNDFYLARNPDGSFPATPGYTNGVKHPDTTLTSYPTELNDPATAAKSSLVNQGLTYTANVLDSSGNVITIELINPLAVSIPLSVNVTGNDIAVTLGTDVAGTIVTTADDVMALLNADIPSFALIVITGSGVTPIVVLAKTNLAGGVDPSTFEGNLFYVLRDPSNAYRLHLLIKKKENQYNINAKANVITIYDALGNLYAIAHVRELNFYAGESISFTIAVEAVTASTLDLVNLGDAERIIVADTRIINVANNTAELQRQISYFAHDYRLGIQSQIDTGKATNLVADLPTLPADSKVLILDGTHTLTASMVMVNNIHLDCDKAAILDLNNIYTLTFQAKATGIIRVSNDATDSVIFQGETWAKIEATAVATVQHDGVGAVLVNGEAQLSTSKAKDLQILNSLSNAIGKLIDDGSGNLDIKSLVANALINFKNDSDADMLTLDNASKKASFKGDVEILGSLLFAGTATVISPQIVTTADNIIILNKGEVGAGVTKASGSSGNTIDRGTMPPFFLGFDEARDAMVIGEIINLINETSAEISACQVIATRENTPIDQATSYWDAASNMFKTDVTQAATRTRIDVYSKSELDTSMATWDHTIGTEAQVKTNLTANVWWNSVSGRFEDSVNALVSFAVGDRILFISSYTHNAAFNFSQSDLHIEALPSVVILSNTAALTFSGSNISVLALAFTKSGAGTVVFNSATGRFVGIKAATGVVTVTSATFCEQSVDGVFVGAGGITGTLQTESQPNITDIGTQLSVDIKGGTIDGATIGAITAILQLIVDNIKIDANAIAATNLNGDINLTPNGTGKVIATKVKLDSSGVIIGGTDPIAQLRVDNIDINGDTIASLVNTLNIITKIASNGSIFITPDGSGKVQISKVFITGGEVYGSTLSGTLGNGGTNFINRVLIKAGSNSIDLNVNGSWARMTISNSFSTFDIRTMDSGSDIQLSPDNGLGAGNVIIANGNLLMTPGKGIDFTAVPGGTGIGTDSLLDDYEEGTFLTAEIAMQTAPSNSSSATYARYVKVGSLVTVIMSWAFKDIRAVLGSGNMRIQTLPFTPVIQSAGVIRVPAVFSGVGKTSNRGFWDLLNGTTYLSGFWQADSNTTPTPMIQTDFPTGVNSHLSIQFSYRTV